MPISAVASRCFKIAEGLLNNPTAPLMEDLPRKFLREFVAQRPQLTLSEDAAGNTLIKYTGVGARKAAPLVLMAHLDHPGFWVKKVSAGKAQLLFKGYIGQPHAHPGLKLEFFERGNATAIGAGTLLKVAYKNKRLVSGVARITSGRAVAGGFTMWDFSAFSIQKDLIVCRAIDDPLGAAAALCALDQIAQRRPRNVAVWGLLTRAEEVGFLGALEALRLRTIPKNAAVLSLEASKALVSAPQGGGVIVRVGDGLSIFNPELTDAVRQAAKRLAKKDKRFRFQRKLMDGGSCEATPFCAFGYRASGVAVPLGNYHNQAFAGKKPTVGPENVKVADFISEVQLLVELALHPDSWKPQRARLPDWIKERMAAARQALKAQATRSWREEV